MITSQFGRSTLRDVVTSRVGEEVKIIFGGKSTATDGKRIFVADLPDSEDEEIRNLAEVSAYHEAEHIRVIQEVSKDKKSIFYRASTVGDLIKRVSANVKLDPKLSKIFQSLWNVYEDIRIDRRANERWPGTLEKYQAVERHIWKKNLANGFHKHDPITKASLIAITRGRDLYFQERGYNPLAVPFAPQDDLLYRGTLGQLEGKVLKMDTIEDSIALALEAVEILKKNFQEPPPPPPQPKPQKGKPQKGEGEPQDSEPQDGDSEEGEPQEGKGKGKSKKKPKDKKEPKDEESDGEGSEGDSENEPKGKKEPKEKGDGAEEDSDSGSGDTSDDETGDDGSEDGSGGEGSGGEDESEGDESDDGDSDDSDSDGSDGSDSDDSDSEGGMGEEEADGGSQSEAAGEGEEEGEEVGDTPTPTNQGGCSPFSRQYDPKVFDEHQEIVDVNQARMDEVTEEAEDFYTVNPAIQDCFEDVTGLHAGQYTDWLARGKPYFGGTGAKIRTILMDERAPKVVNSLPRGKRLDTQHLYRHNDYKFGKQPAIWETRLNGRNIDTALYLSIDESSSMDGSSWYTQCSILAALCQILDTCSAKYLVSGWTDGGNQQTAQENSCQRNYACRFRRYNKWDSRLNPADLPMHPMNDGTPTFEDITYGLAELSARREARKAFVMFTDGEPVYGNYQMLEAAQKYGIEQLERARQAGYKTFGFGIGIDQNNASMKALFKDNWVGLDCRGSAGDQALQIMAKLKEAFL
jgi:hypothetical protein